MNISDGSIDIHAHFYPEAYLRLLEKHGAEHSAGCDMSNPEGVVIKAGPQLIPPLERRFVDLDLRIEEMNEIGVGVHALSLTIPMVGFAGGQFALQLSEAYNDACVEAHQKYPDRLVGLCYATMACTGPRMPRTGSYRWFPRYTWGLFGHSCRRQGSQRRIVFSNLRTA